MKEVLHIEHWLWRIKSEPGDGTRYEYMILKDYDEFFFMPTRETFRYPQHLNYWEIKNADEEAVLAIAEKEQCNPWTVKESIRTALEMYQNSEI